MKYDPEQKKPNTANQNKKKPAILINPQARKCPKKPPERRWKVSQYVPLVKHGLAGNGTHAVMMLNLSWLPEDASPNSCLTWARAFMDAVEGGMQARAAAVEADKVIK